MGKLSFWLTILVIVIVLGVVVVKYNKLASLDEAMNEAWNPLMNTLSPRYEEVPKLVNEIILYVGSEDSETKTLADAYKKYKTTNNMEEQVTAAEELETALSAIFIQEGQRYAGIASHYQYMNLKQGFDQTGEKMGVLVASYNKAVDNYDTYRRQFPNDIVGELTGFASKAVYFRKEQ